MPESTTPDLEPLREHHRELYGALLDSRSVEVAQAAIEAAQRLAAHDQAGPEDHWHTGWTLLASWQISQDRERFAQAVHAFGRARMQALDDDTRAAAALSVARAWYMRVGTDPDSLDQAITEVTAVVQSAGVAQTELAELLTARFAVSFRPSDLNAALDLYTRAGGLPVPVLIKAAVLLAERFQLIGADDSLYQAIELMARAIVNTHDSEDPESQEAARVFGYLLRSLPRTSEAGSSIAAVLLRVIAEAEDTSSARQFLVGTLEYLFQETGSVADLRALVDVLGHALEEPDSGLPPHGMAVAWLNHSAELLREGTLGTHELDGVIGILVHTLTDQETLPSALDSLAVELARAVQGWTLVTREPTVEQLDGVLKRTEAAAEVVGDRIKVVLMIATSALYLKRSNRSGRRDHADATVEAYEFLHERLAGPDQISLKVSLAHTYHSRYENFGVLSDLERTITLLEEAVAAGGEGDGVGDASSGVSLAGSLLQRFSRGEVHPDADWYRAAELLESAMAAELAYPWLRNGLAQEVARLFVHGLLLHRLPALEWVERLHALYDKALTLADTDGLVSALTQASNTLTDHFRELSGPDQDQGDIALPDAAVADCVARLKHTLAADEASQVRELDEELRQTLGRVATDEYQLKGWASAYESRYDSGEAIDDLFCAVATLRACARSVTETVRLANLLTVRYPTTGLVSDLDEAIELFGGLLRATPGQVHRRRLLNDLSGAHWRRYEHTGLAADLDTSVESMRAALELTPEESGSRALYLSNLAGKLDARFVALGSRSDLNEVIMVGSEAARLAGTENLGIRYSALNGLGGAYRRRYQLDRNPDDMRLALDTLGAALDGLEADDPIRPRALTNLAACTLVGMSEPEVHADLDEVVAMLRTATAATGARDPVRTGRFFMLAQALLIRTSEPGHAADREEALAILHGLVPSNRVAHPNQIEPAEALALELRSDDPQTACALSRETARAVFARAPTRISAARTWAALSAAAGDAQDALTAWETVLDLFDVAAWRGKPRLDQEESLAEHQGVASSAAAYAVSVGRPAHAVELLERGRSVLWNQVLERRAGRSESLNARLRKIAESLEHGGSVDELVRLGREWDRLKAEAAAEYGEWNPFAAPTYEALQRGAGEATVVINVAPLRSDALVMAEGAPRVIELPGLEFAETVRQASAFLQAVHTPGPGVGGYIAAQHTAREVLDWLWRAVTAPVLDTLGDSRRIRWCPTGMLSLLPLHAATDAATGASALDRVVSSYTPTLRAMAAATPHGARKTVDRILTVGVADYLEHPPLASVDREAETVRRLLPHARHTSLINAKATVRAVRSELPGNPCVHFACHGIQDFGAPSSGGVALADGTLSILDIARLRFEGAELAYLSACQTATGGTRLPDESLHLAAALHLAGFRQVVGTLWAVRDTLAADVAGDFYAAIAAKGLDGAADAIAGATRKLRDRYPLEPLLWAGFVHMG
ncbi:CHAT domain-containing protein [Streptomyces sp. NPDC056975]|uniref:CHAT domain-containing protein n=1 Tax=Streptomyces sp. NPDC056975 TaxID=3345985 RepID=UPI003636BA79